MERRTVCDCLGKNTSNIKSSLARILHEVQIDTLTMCHIFGYFKGFLRNYSVQKAKSVSFIYLLIFRIDVKNEDN